MVEEVHPNPAQDETRAGRGTEGNGNSRLRNEPTPVEQGRELGLLIERKCRNCPTFRLKNRQ